MSAAWQYYFITLLVYTGVNLIAVWGLNLQFGFGGNPELWVYHFPVRRGVHRRSLGTRTGDHWRVSDLHLGRPPPVADSAAGWRRGWWIAVTGGRRCGAPAQTDRLSGHGTPHRGPHRDGNHQRLPGAVQWCLRHI